MKQLFQLVAFAGLLTLASCFGQHNQAPSEGANLDDPRIYGNKGGEPLQLPNKYPDDESGAVADRAEKIRNNFFPKGTSTDTSGMSMMATDTTQASTEVPATAEGSN